MTQVVRHDAMRAGNLAVVLDAIATRGPVSRAALAELTGLTKTTVSKLVGDLLDGGLVSETPAPRDGERGRPAVAVRLSGDRLAALGLEINVDYLAACVVDLTRTVRLRRTQAVDNRSSYPQEVVENLGTLAREVVENATGLGLTVVRGMLAVPGPVNPAAGIVHSAPNLGWRDVPALRLLDAGVPMAVDNEANLAALGELWFGGGAGLGDFLHVSGEIGVGAGLVVDGRLFRGAHGFAGELGHVVVSPDGPPCHCGGRGCLERYAGQEALLSGAFAGAPSGDPSPGVPDLTAGSPAGPTTRLPDGTTAPAPLSFAGTTAPASRSFAGTADLVAAAEAGDPAALAACERAGWALGVALSSAVNLVDPDTVVLGGIFAPLYPWVSGPAATALRERLGRMRPDVPTVAVSRTGPDAAVLGAAGQIIHDLLADPAQLLTT